MGIGGENAHEFIVVTINLLLCIRHTVRNIHVKICKSINGQKASKTVKGTAG